MKGKISTACQLAAVALLLTASAHGAAVLTETFDSFPDGNLAGQDGWSAYTAGTSTVQVASHKVSMSPGLVAPLEITRKALGTTYNTAGTSLYYGLDVDVTATTNGGDWVAGFSSSGGAYGAKLFAKNSGTGGYVLGWFVGSGSTGVEYGSSLNFDTPVRVVMQYDFVSGANNDTGAIYVIPSTATDFSNPASYLYLSWTTFATQSDNSSISAINFHRGGSNGPTMTMDNLAVGGWSDVAAVPEPTVCMLALSSLSLLTLRPRKS